MAVIKKLVKLYLKHGSVNAVCEVLNEALLHAYGDDPSMRIYPNRLHSLLSDDNTRAFNEFTIIAVEDALAGLQEISENEVAAAAQSVSGDAPPAVIAYALGNSSIVQAHKLSDGRIINLPLSKSDAHVILQALATHADNVDDATQCTWIAERILRILSPELGIRPIDALHQR